MKIVRVTSFVVAGALLAASPCLAQPAAPPARTVDQGLAEAVRAGQHLKRGDSGAAVRELQALLGQHGHATAVDGDFGPSTDAAVRAFQRARSLPVDGVVGPDTLAALERPAASSGAAGGIVPALGGPRRAASPPSASTPVAEAHAASLPWARAAHAAGRHTLIVVFEGLWAYSSDYAARIYAYQDQLRAGGSPARPAASGLSFVGKQLIVPQMRETHAKADLLLLPETSENGEASIAEQAVRAWHQVHGAALKVVVVGHSFGGWSALRLARKLERRSLRVASILTVDARSIPTNYPQFVTPPNVGEHANFFQKSLWMPGYRVDGATNVKLFVNHGAIPGAPEVVATYRRMVR